MVLALEAAEPVFREFEKLRITLAKHEIPKAKGMRAFAPGYARIDQLTGGLSWMIEDKAGFSKIIRRYDLGEALAGLRIVAEPDVAAGPEDRT